MKPPFLSSRIIQIIIQNPVIKISTQTLHDLMGILASLAYRVTLPALPTDRPALYKHFMVGGAGIMT